MNLLATVLPWAAGAFVDRDAACRLAPAARADAG